MNQSKSRATLALAVAAILFAGAASSAIEPPKESCANIKWNPAFLRDHPNAPVTCQEVSVKDGVKYAKFYGKVSKVESRRVEVEISDVGAIPVSTIAFEVGKGGESPSATKPST